MADIQLHSKFFTPRLEYIANQIFKFWYGLEIEFIEDITVGVNEYVLFRNDGLRLYSSTSEILYSDEISENFDFDWEKISSVDLNSQDWIGVCFFLISRMEEYTTKEKDFHGRFSYKSSVAHRKGFLEFAIIDELVFKFIKEYFPERIQTNKKLEITPTIDIDMTHAYLGRNFLRQLGGLLKDLLKGKVSERIKVLMGKMQDPFVNFDYQISVFTKNELTAQYFFQVGDYGKYDKNISPKKSIYNSVLEKLKNHNIGVHPSYKSMEVQGLIRKEKDILAQVSNRQIVSSRQHFLRFSIPETYREIWDSGIKKEFSMGYSDTVGFRAGTSRKFFWFDLNYNKMSDLEIQPFSVMDVALQVFENLNYEQAIEKINGIKERLKQINGTFSFCFHNETLSERNQWKNWRKVFEEICKS